jgi:ubiquinone/menaquinone biosynthesis C-methylase UbiE
LDAYKDAVDEQYPWLAEMLWFERPGASRALSELLATHNEFETEANDGRGLSYRAAQRNAAVRLAGIQQLLALAGGMGNGRPARILDILGGDGTIARALLDHAGVEVSQLPVITSDIAGEMIRGAIGYGLPAVRQAAQFLFLREACLDGVVLAYGAHHITGDERTLACGEALRALRPGGRFVLHDFEEGLPMAKWFNEVVDTYTHAGHRYDHFTEEEMRARLADAGFAHVEVRRVYDPFIVSAESAEQARRRLTQYVFQMYGLAKLGVEGVLSGEGEERLWEIICDYLRWDFSGVTEREAHWQEAPVVERRGKAYVAEMPRVALVASARHKTRGL